MGNRGLRAHVGEEIAVGPGVGPVVGYGEILGARKREPPRGENLGFQPWARGRGLPASWAEIRGSPGKSMNMKIRIRLWRKSVGCQGKSPPAYVGPCQELSVGPTEIALGPHNRVGPHREISMSHRVGRGVDPQSAWAPAGKIPPGHVG